MRVRPIKEQLPIEPSQFLSGWKEIATYLGKGVRTVQRYERHMGLPIRRPAGKAAGSVVATRAELDAWVKASPIREVYSLNNPLPEYDDSTRAIRTGLSEMNHLRDQMFTLRHDLVGLLQSLRDNVIELQERLSLYGLHDHRPFGHSVDLLAGDQRDSLERSQLDLLEATTKHAKVS